MEYFTGDPKTCRGYPDACPCEKITGKCDAPEEEEQRPICFLVNVKDLSDPEKNPNFSLSPKEILKNPKIPKKFL